MRIKETQYLLIIFKNIFRRRRRQKHTGREGEYLGEWERRFEGSGGEGVGVGGVWLEMGEEDMECKSRNEVVRMLNNLGLCGEVGGSATSLRLWNRGLINQTK